MILVVILPVAQMILVLVIISLLRVCYVTYCYTEQPDDPKMLQVVSSAQQQDHQERREQLQADSRVAFDVASQSAPTPAAVATSQKPSINNLKY